MKNATRQSLTSKEQMESANDPDRRPNTDMNNNRQTEQRNILITPTIFPLYGIIREERGVRCDCREGAACKRIGKHPACKWGELRPGEKRRGPSGNYGLATGWKSGIFVVDTDGKPADEMFRSMGPLPAGLVVRTPRAEGGFHYYFKWPGWPVRTGKSVLGPNIDVRGEGGLIVIEGSEHKNGGRYTREVDAGIPDAPEWLLSDQRLRGRITDENAENAPEPIDPTWACWDSHVNLAIEACESCTDQGGTEMFKLCIRLVRDLLLPLEKAQEIIEEHYCPRVQGEPWLPKDIARKLTEARDKSEKKAGDAHPIVLRAPEVDTCDAARTKLGTLLDVLGLLGKKNEDGSRNVACLCGATGLLRRNGRFRCPGPTCKFTSEKDFLRAVAS
jgi:hypothetical protein